MNDIEKSTRSAIARPLSHHPVGPEFDKQVILEALRAAPFRDNAQLEFGTLLHKGIIAKTPSGDYAVPIPSMSDWLVTHYGPETQRQASSYGMWGIGGVMGRSQLFRGPDTMD